LRNVNELVTDQESLKKKEEWRKTKHHPESQNALLSIDFKHYKDRFQTSFGDDFSEFALSSFSLRRKDDFWSKDSTIFGAMLTYVVPFETNLSDKV